VQFSIWLIHAQVQRQASHWRWMAGLATCVSGAPWSDFTEYGSGGGATVRLVPALAAHLD
jgi:hypothetical protein